MFEYNFFFSSIIGIFTNSTLCFSTFDDIVLIDVIGKHVRIADSTVRDMHCYHSVYCFAFSVHKLNLG